MSTDGWSEYDNLIGDLEKDTRVGDHDFMVSNVETGKWSDLRADLSEDPYYKVEGVLLTAEQAKCSLQWSPPPPASVVKSDMAKWKPGKRKAIAQAVTIAKHLAQFYGKHIMDLKSGDVLRVKTVKTKRDDSGKGGFIRVAAILPKEQIGQDSMQAAKDASDIPF